MLHAREGRREGRKPFKRRQTVKVQNRKMKAKREARVMVNVQGNPYFMSGVAMDVTIKFGLTIRQASAYRSWS